VPRCRQYLTVETGALVISATSSVVSRSVLMSIAISISSRRPVAAGLTRHRRNFAAVTATGGQSFSTGTGGSCLVSAAIALRGDETYPVPLGGPESIRSSAAVAGRAGQLRDPSEGGRVAGQQSRN
jgi:hypothetical protein